MDAYGPTEHWGDVPTETSEIDETLVESVGFLVEQEKHVILIPNYIPNTKQSFGNTVIPRGMIVSIVDIS
jgi:hypothetical protein